MIGYALHWTKRLTDDEVDEARDILAQYNKDELDEDEAIASLMALGFFGEEAENEISK